MRGIIKFLNNTKNFHFHFMLVIRLPHDRRALVDRRFNASEIKQLLYLHLFGSVLDICHFNINLTEAGVMHEAGYVYSI